MLLKIGYVEIDGSVSWKYFNNISNLRVYPFNESSFLYKRDGEYVEDISVDGERDSLKNNETRLSFNKNYIDSDTYLTEVVFWDTQDEQIKKIYCLKNTVFLMNENGKTIDKY